jgi:phosphatidylinositol alpha-1,6-mannosyltransferase
VERTGVPFGILLHGGDLLILQHQIHQSAVKRKTAAALLSSAAVLVANSDWTRDRCLTVLSELEIDVPADRVRFLTDVPDRDLPALYNCAEIYLGVSRLMEQRVEGFGISLAEASACGIPVIAGRSGGIPAAVRDGETGLLVDAEGVDAVAEAIGRLLDDAGLRARLGAAGRRAVESHYNWDRVTTDLRRIGHELGAAAGQVVQ